MKKRGSKVPTLASSRKSKARNLQKEIAQKIGDTIGLPHVVGYDEECLIQPARMGQGGVDIKINPAIRELFPYAIECKNTETWSVPSAVRQARKYVCKGYTDWIVFLRKKEFKKTMAVIEADTLFLLLKEVHDVRQRRATRTKRRTSHTKK